MSNMSEAWMPFHPAIDEPSNAWPDSNLSCRTALAGIETCCSLPRVSVKRRSTNLTSFSLMSLSTSAAVVIGILLSGTGRGRVHCNTNLKDFSDNYAIAGGSEFD